MDNRLNIWIRFLLPLFLALFLGVLIFMMAQFREPPGVSWYIFVWFVGSILLIWESGWWISKKLDVQFPWKKGTIRRLSMHLLVTNLLGILFFLGSFILLNWYENAGLGYNNPLGLLHILVVVSEAFIIIQIINSIQISYQLLQTWQAVRLEAEALKKENVIARLENVRQQLDPYFLNNSFSQLEPLLKEAPEKVSDFLQKISNNYQSSQALLDSSLVHAQQVLQVEEPKTVSYQNGTSQESPTYKNRFLVKSGAKLFLIPVSEIVVIYKDDIVLLFTKDGKKYPLDYSLEELTSLLHPQHFFRINRQYIIQATYLDEMRAESNQLLISLKVPFPHPLAVSQRNVAVFKKWLREEGG